MTITVSKPMVVGSHDIVEVDPSGWFGVSRGLNDEAGRPTVDLRKQHPNHPPFLAVYSMHEGETLEIVQNVFVTVVGAKAQSKVRIRVQSPPNVKATVRGDPLAEADAGATVIGYDDHHVPLRKVALAVPGELYLHSMPARRETWKQFSCAMGARGIGRVVCLASAGEIKRKSPAYDQALTAGVPWLMDEFPIPDFGVPDDESAFWELAQNIAKYLMQGERVLVHCGAGIGRTGMFAVAVIKKLGISSAVAFQLIKAAGSGPETDAQRDLLS